MVELPDSMQRRVLLWLADGQTVDSLALRGGTGCTLDVLNGMVQAGLIRIPDVSAGGHKVCITPRGLDRLTTDRQRAAELLWD
jgi:hypothetical protein